MKESNHKEVPIHLSGPEGSGEHVLPPGPMRYEPVVRSALELLALRRLDDDLSGPAVIATPAPVDALRGAEDLAGISVRPVPETGPGEIDSLLSVVRERQADAATGLLVDPLALACFYPAESRADRSLRHDPDSIRSELLRIGRSAGSGRSTIGCVDALAARDAGASRTTVLAWTLLSLSAWLDHLDPVDLESGGRIQRLRILVPVGNHPVLDAAFVTAVRDLTSGLVTAYSVENGGADRCALPVLQAVSSSQGIVRSAAPADDAGNLVRATLQAVAAASAGADILSLLPYDEHREPTPDSVRLSAGIHRLLRHESGLNRTVQPLAGSYAFETMVRTFSDAARDLFIELSDVRPDVPLLRDRIRQRIGADRAGSPAALRVGLDRYVPEEEIDAA